MPILAILLLLSCAGPSGPSTYERIVIDTYPYDTGGSVDTYMELFDENGDPDPADDFWAGADSNVTDALAWDDDSGSGSIFARIDYVPASPVPSGTTYYIRVRGAYQPFDDVYAIRVLSLRIGDSVPAEIYPGAPADKPDYYEDDDDSANNWVMLTPVTILPGNSNFKNRSLDLDAGNDDVDWFKLVLP